MLQCLNPQILHKCCLVSKQWRPGRLHVDIFVEGDFIQDVLSWKRFTYSVGLDEQIETHVKTSIEIYCMMTEILKDEQSHVVFFLGQFY